MGFNPSEYSNVKTITTRVTKWMMEPSFYLLVPDKLGFILDLSTS